MRHTSLYDLDQHRTLAALFTCFWPKRSGDCHLEVGGWRCHQEVRGWREGDLLFCLEGEEHTASKDKDEKEKERKERKKKKEKKKKKKKKGGGGGGLGRTVEVINNESVDKIYHEPKNEWLKLYKR